MPVAETVRGFKEIVDGEHDDIPERAFYMQGPIEQVLEEAKGMKGEEPSEAAAGRGRRAGGEAGGGRGPGDQGDRGGGGPRPMAEHTLHAKVLTPEGEVFEGEVEQLSTRTAVGEIGILANHVPVLARLRPTELRLHMPGRRGPALGAGRGLAAGVRQPGDGPGRRGDPARPARRGTLRDRIEDAEQRLGESEEGSGAHRRPSGTRRAPRRSWRSPAPRLTERAAAFHAA